MALTGFASLALFKVPAPIERWLQARVLLALRQYYRRDVRQENLRVTLVPVFRVTADNSVVPNGDVTGLPPFLAVRLVGVEALPLQLLRRPVHLSWVKLDGLVIKVPARGDKNSDETPGLMQKARLADFVIDRVDADGTRLYVLPKQEGRKPIEWELRGLTLRRAGIGQLMRYTAALTNPKPPEIIYTTGRFGPWNMDEPSETAVSGHYDFWDADLSMASRECSLR